MDGRAWGRTAVEEARPHGCRARRLARPFAGGLEDTGDTLVVEAEGVASKKKTHDYRCSDVPTTEKEEEPDEVLVDTAQSQE